MSLTRRHALYAVQYDSTLCGGVSQQNIVTGSDVRGEPTDAEIYARILALYEQKIVPSFSTYCLVQHLDELSALGVSIADMTLGLSLFAQAHLKGGSRAGATAHREYNFTEGIVFPQSINVSHRGDAELSVGAVIGYDGSNDPMTITDDVTLTAITGEAERFTMGPVTIESVLLAQKTNVSINFGLQVESEGVDSIIWDEFVSIVQCQPVIEITGIDIEWLKAANIPLTGKSVTHANTDIYLAKRAHGGTFVADETAEHIKFTAAGLIVPDECFSSSGQAPGQVKLTMPCYYDGTNAPITIDTTSAIT